MWVGLRVLSQCPEVNLAEASPSLEQLDSEDQKDSVREASSSLSVPGTEDFEEHVRKLKNREVKSRDDVEQR